MSEFEILEHNSLNYINNGMYMVALAILIFIALRVARVTNESGVELSIQGKAWLTNSGVTSGDYLMEPPMFADIPSVLLTLVILLMILGTTWGPRIKIGVET